MRILILTPLALLAAGPALALEVATPSAGAAAPLSRAPREGEVLRDSGARIIGKVSRVQPSGGVVAIVNGGTVRIPANTLSIVDGKLVTTLTKSEVIKLK